MRRLNDGSNIIRSSKINAAHEPWGRLEVDAPLATPACAEDPYSDSDKTKLVDERFISRVRKASVALIWYPLT